jgi:transposase
MSHPNAILTPRGRLQLAQCVVDQCWSLRRAAERFQVSVPPAARWARRYREHCPAGMEDDPAARIPRSGGQQPVQSGGSLPGG